MITNTGKSIIARYLLGQTTDYASYIAIGCGPKPIDAQGGTFDTDAYKLRDNLEFEMFRVPVISRGTVTEDGKTKIVLSAELPTENRYEISEIGVFSAGSNPALGAYSSRNLFTFSDGESWLYNSAIPSLITDTLDDGSGNFITSVSGKAFYANSDNPIFTNERVLRYETPRFMNSSLFVPGNSSNMTNTNGVLALPQEGGNPIKVNGIDIDLDRYSSEDEIRIAFAAVAKDNPQSPVSLGSVRVKVEFRYSAEATSPKATFDAVVQNANGLNDHRYFVVSKKIKDFAPADFSWASVSVIHIYVSTHPTTNGVISTNSTSDFFVALDGMRIENAQSNNPLYGMIGYSVLKNKDAKTIIKKNNSTSYVEFRFALDVN